MSTTNESLATLREILHRSPSKAAFATLCDALDGWDSEQPLAMDYVREHLDAHWPKRVRVPSRGWVLQSLSGDWPWAWSLATNGFNVDLYYTGYRRAQILHVVRQFNRFGLRQVHRLVDACPGAVVLGISHRQAEYVCSTLTQLEASADILPWEPDHSKERFAVWFVGTAGVTLNEAGLALYGAGWHKAPQQIHDIVAQLPYLLRDDLPERYASALARELRARGLRVRVQPSAGLRFLIRIAHVPEPLRLAMERYLASRGLPDDDTRTPVERLAEWPLIRFEAEEVARALERLGLSVELEEVSR